MALLQRATFQEIFLKNLFLAKFGHLFREPAIFKELGVCWVPSDKPESLVSHNFCTCGTKKELRRYQKRISKGTLLKKMLLVSRYNRNGLVFRLSKKRINTVGISIYAYYVMSPGNILVDLLLVEWKMSKTTIFCWCYQRYAPNHSHK